MSVPVIFKDSDLQRQFQQDGFAKISLLDEASVKRLSDMFYTYMKGAPDSFYSSSYLQDYTQKKLISTKIGEVILPRLERFFCDFTWFGSAYLSKGNGPATEMPMHQDWTIVDERMFVALNIWTPLQDTNEENGTLEVIPGSHRFHACLRAPTLPFYFMGHEDAMKKLLVPIHTKAGEAIVLNQAVIHYSKPNMTEQDRLAITTGIKTSGAPMLFYYWNKEEPDVVREYSQDEDFLLQWADFHKDIFLPPKFGRIKGKKALVYPETTQSEVDLILEHAGVKEPVKRNIWERIFGQS